jgi:hypothetical protein
MEDEDSYLHKKTILVIARRSGEAGSTKQSHHSKRKIEIAAPCPRRSRGQPGLAMTKVVSSPSNANASIYFQQMFQPGLPGFVQKAGGFIPRRAGGEKRLSHQTKRKIEIATPCPRRSRGQPGLAMTKVVSSPCSGNASIYFQRMFQPGLPGFIQKA